MKHLLLAGLCALSLASCDREKAPPPKPKTLTEATQVGANTASCLINGQLWVADTREGNPNTWENKTTVLVYQKEVYIEMNLMNLMNEYKNYINIKFQIPGNIVLNQSYFTENTLIAPHKKSLIGYTDDKSINYITQSPDFKGEIRFSKVDVSNKIIAGIFSFKAVDKNGNVVTITQGRFDRKINF